MKAVDPKEVAEAVMRSIAAVHARELAVRGD
jgi:hypothetical protein